MERQRSPLSLEEEYRRLSSPVKNYLAISRRLHDKDLTRHEIHALRDQQVAILAKHNTPAKNFRFATELGQYLEYRDSLLSRTS